MGKPNKDDNQEEQKVTRAPLPSEGNVIGKVEQRHGGNKMKVNCTDGKERNCRVPGRLKRRLWLRPGHLVIVEPWELEPDTRGDIILKYNKTQAQWLKDQGHTEGIEEEEF